MAADALGAIETLGPKAPPGHFPAVDGGAARAYAPAGSSIAPKSAPRRPLDESLADPGLAPGLAALAANPNLDWLRVSTLSAVRSNVSKAAR